MLDDKIVKIGYPHGAVRTDLGVYRGEPLIGAREEIIAVLFREARPLFLQDGLVHQSSGRLVHEGDPVPIFLRETARRVEVEAGGSRVASMDIHLPYAGSNRSHAVVTVDFLAARALRQSFHVGREAIGNANVHRVRVIGSRAKKI